jgi:hypothetical protein
LVLSIVLPENVETLLDAYGETIPPFRISQALIFLYQKIPKYWSV